MSKGMMSWDWSPVNAAMAVVARDGYHEDVDAMYRSIKRLRSALVDHDVGTARAAEHEVVMLAARVLERASCGG